MSKKNNRGFTLVELIVVVTILAILATIGFVSYSSYLTWVRDTNRTSQLRSLSDGLNLYSTRNTLPRPENAVDVSVTVWGIDYMIATQWDAGVNILETINFEKWWKDPKDNTFFTYKLSKDRNNFQLMAFLEEASALSWGGSVSFGDRFPLTDGTSLWALIDTSNTPIHQISSVRSDGELMLDGTWDIYIAQLNNEEQIIGNDSTVLYGSYVKLAGRWNRSCKEILAKHPYIENTDWVFWVRTQSDTLKVPCDMTTDGGWWTMVLHGNDSDIEKYDSRWAGNWNNSNTFIPFSSTGSSLKMTDNIINEIRAGGAYMTTATRTTDFNLYKYFTPSSCNYNHELSQNGDCATLYSDSSHSTPISCSSDPDWWWIWCYNPVGTQGIVTNRIDRPANVVCYNPFAWCTNEWLGMEVKMYVR